MRNWPYALALANRPESPVAGKIGIAPLPRDAAGVSSAVLGGSQLAVSRYSRAPDAAIDLVRALTGAEEQRRRAIASGFNPTIERLIPRSRASCRIAFTGELRKVVASAVARPSAVTGRRYNQVSNEY
jgi:trehalose/maltose transport system substrate-binding protein